MEKKNIKRLAATGILSTALITGSGLAIHDKNIDHTKEVCPITRIINIIPNLSELEFGMYLPTGIAVHQWPEMEKDFTAQGIEDAVISYGKRTDQSNEIYYGLKATWGETSFNWDSNEFEFENETILKIR